MDCSICIEPMTTKVYIQPNEDCEDKVDDQDHTCNRLKCGHAFHSSCIFASFRAGLGCPLCRESQKEEQFNDFDATDPIISRLDQERTKIRINSKTVRLLRRDLNLKLRKYRLLAEHLRKERRLCLSKALREFRLKHKSEFKILAEEVSESLFSVETGETEELLKYFSIDEVTAYLNHIKDFDYDPLELMRCKDTFAADPLTVQFWK